MIQRNLNMSYPTWTDCLHTALTRVDAKYLESLECTTDWLPDHHRIFNAFSLPINRVNYVLFGESPYPRRQSANGFAFWDEAVNDIWSSSGLSKTVNRATSLRNIIKMLLIAEGRLTAHHTTQDYISQLDKSDLVQTNHDLFSNFLEKGFLLLNATPVLQEGSPEKDAKAWQPFMQYILSHLLKENPHVTLLLFGRLANKIEALLPPLPIKKLYAEHPYNVSFITNPTIIDFFKPLHLLKKSS